MKYLIPFSALAAIAATGSIHAAPVFSDTSGYTTQTLPANTTSLVGINLVKPAVVSSTITGVSGVTITDSTKDFTSLLTAGKTYTFEVTSGTTTTPATAGTAPGAIEWFVTWTGNNITLPGTENVTGVAVGDKYTIRLAPTVQELFPVGSLAGTSGANFGNADKVWVPQGNGTYVKYAYRTAGVNLIGWHRINAAGNASTGLVTVDIPIPYNDGLLVEKRGTAGSIVQTGQVKKSTSNFYVTGGFNLVSIIPPVRSTFFTCGLGPSDVATTSGANFGTADKVWVPQGNGTYIRYAYRTSGVNQIGWHTMNAAGNASTGLVTVDFDLPSAIFIQRISNTPKLMTFDVPSGYSGL